jgi:uncharacterized protein (TIGR00375 family)
MSKWKCTKCGKRIKKGVKDRVNELASYKLPKHPSHRPSYLYLVPLAEIISKAIGQKSPATKTVFKYWDGLISEFGDEVSVLVDVDIDDIAKVTDGRVTETISALRKGRVIFHPGGGGQYGYVEFPDDEYEFEAEEIEKKEGQTSLFEL